MLPLPTSAILTHPLSFLGVPALVLALALPSAHAGDPRPLLRYGSMHETLAKGEDQARIRLSDLLETQDLYAIGAVEGLQGEITILDSEGIVSSVEDGQPRALDASTQSATLLVGQTVRTWSNVDLQNGVAPEYVDVFIGDAAAEFGLDTAAPFFFVAEGRFTDVRLHVLNGACPVRARVKMLDIPPNEKPYEMEAENIEGTVVGLYAEDAVGKLTHPATRIHAHLIYVDEESGETVTGHLERVGIAEGSLLKVPATPRAVGGD